MFKEKMETTATPGRVYCLCQIVRNHQNGVSEKRLKEEMMLVDQNDIYSTTRKTAEELELIRSESKFLIPTAALLKLDTIDAFKKYIIHWLPRMKEGIFWKTTQAILELDGKYLEDSDSSIVSNLRIENALREYFPNNPIPNDKDRRAWRFWASFLGLGHTLGNDGVQFFPDGTEYLKLLIDDRRNYLGTEEMSIKQFIVDLGDPIELLISEKDMRDRRLNLAASTALSTLHSEKYIHVTHRLDEKEMWQGQFLPVIRHEVSRIQMMDGIDHE